MILLDTCTILWDALEADKLTTEAKQVIERSANELIICDSSLWEIAMLIRKRRLAVDDTIRIYEAGASSLGLPGVGDNTKNSRTVR